MFGWNIALHLSRNIYFSISYFLFFPFIFRCFHFYLSSRFSQSRWSREHNFYYPWTLNLPSQKDTVNILCSEFSEFERSPPNCPPSMRKAAGIHVHEREDIWYSLRLRPSLSHRLFCVRYYFFSVVIEAKSGWKRNVEFQIHFDFCSLFSS